MVLSAALGVALSWALLPTSPTVGGFSLVYAASPVVLVGALILWAALVGGLAALSGAGGNPLAAPAVVGVALLGPAVGAGSIDGWIRRFGSPGAYGWLAVELAVWAGLIAAMLLGGWAARPALRRRLPGVLRLHHYHELDEADQSPSVQATTALGPILIAAAVVFIVDRRLVTDFVACLMVSLALLAGLWAAALGVENLRLGRSPRHVPPSATTGFLAATVSVSIGQLALFLFMRSEAIGQVVGTLIVGFAVATLIGHQMFPTARRLPLLLAPLIAGAAAYLWAAGSINDPTHLLARFFAHYSQQPIPALLPPARALPVHYAAAGVLGSAIGMGWSQGLHAAAQKHVAVVGA